MLGNKALVLFSGGQDSTTVLYWAKQNFNEVVAVTFSYMQRHMLAELEATMKISELAQVEHVNLYATNIGQWDNSALLNKTSSLNEVNQRSGLPASFVPGRNIFFLTLAAVEAYKRGISHLVMGVCETDYSGYPDCRQTFITNMQSALSYGMAWDMYLHTPLMYLTKCEEVQLAQCLPGCLDALTWSHTCYEGTFPPCGICPACLLRARGFQEAGVIDPILNRPK